MIRVGANGYGTIGKRIADAILLQDDMRLVGVSKTKPDYGAKIARRRSLPLYSVYEERIPLFESRGLDVCGSVDDLVEASDVIVDCSPAGVGAENKEIYERHGKKAVFEGGENKDIADMTFVAQCNYQRAMDRKYLKVASCNTTALCRTLDRIDKSFGIKNSFVTIARRAVDPHESKKGPIDAIIPNSLDLPTHHAYDVREVLPNMNIFTVSIKIPTKIMHVQVVMAELNNHAREDEVIDLLEKSNRTLLVQCCDGFESTSQIIEMSRDLGRERNDIWETVVWEDSITVNDGRLYLIQAVHQEAIVVPENIDAIRASFNLCDVDSSIKKTNDTLGIMASRF